MTQQTTSTPSFALFGQMVARAWRVFNNRRQFAELKDWSDEQLKDVGLTRSDVRRAMAQPFYRDPTASLLSGSPVLHRRRNLQAANAPQARAELTLVETVTDNGQLAA
ncbi:DUF1127 domain-containing protein [Roseibium marinum]|uniref:Uncharacterized protein YjiS (DUF1127 family) n=1 Tax=Roseibium marinum TaxID=281252 RepID=A0A2S3V3U9_9HYPH|nr:DUF1127 domain-containing protein [Roseibium marinum]POF34628.1 uncharacterized protein YjiS (DUF1127 family) [Roseibium marinum]